MKACMINEAGKLSSAIVSSKAANYSEWAQGDHRAGKKLKKKPGKLAGKYS